MKKLTTTNRFLITLIICLVAAYFFISLAIRCLLFFNEERVFGEWTELMDELSADKPQEPHPFPHNYYMHSLFEVYAVKQFRFYDSSGTLTEEQIREEFQPLADAANVAFTGSEARIYIGHENPYRITPKYFPARFIFLKDLLFGGENADPNYWHVIIYKRARNPFRL